MHNHDYTWLHKKQEHQPSAKAVGHIEGFFCSISYNRQAKNTESPLMGM